MIVKQNQYEFKIYAFETEEGLEEQFPDEERRKRYFASLGYISVSKDFGLITIDCSLRRISSEEAGKFIRALNKARNIADSIIEKKKIKL